MTEAAHRHALLEEFVLYGRELGTLARDVDRRICAEMAELWWQMTDEEREESDRRGIEYTLARKVAVAQLGEDRPVQRGDHLLPRAA